MNRTRATRANSRRKATDDFIPLEKKSKAQPGLKPEPVKDDKPIEVLTEDMNASVAEPNMVCEESNKMETACENDQSDKMENDSEGNQSDNENGDDCLPVYQVDVNNQVDLKFVQESIGQTKAVEAPRSNEFKQIDYEVSDNEEAMDLDDMGADSTGKTDEKLLSELDQVQKQVKGKPAKGEEEKMVEEEVDEVMIDILPNDEIHLIGRIHKIIGNKEIVIKPERIFRAKTYPLNTPSNNSTATVNTSHVDSENNSCTSTTTTSTTDTSSSSTTGSTTNNAAASTSLGVEASSKIDLSVNNECFKSTLDIDSVICTAQHEYIGKITDIIGQVNQPHYIVKKVNKSVENLEVGMHLYAVERLSTILLPNNICFGRGVANDDDDEQLYFSDDEKEKEYEKKAYGDQKNRDERNKRNGDSLQPNKRGRDSKASLNGNQRGQNNKRKRMLYSNGNADRDRMNFKRPDRQGQIMDRYYGRGGPRDGPRQSGYPESRDYPRDPYYDDPRRRDPYFDHAYPGRDPHAMMMPDVISPHYAGHPAHPGGRDPYIQYDSPVPGGFVPYGRREDGYLPPVGYYDNQYSRGDPRLDMIPNVPLHPRSSNTDPRREPFYAHHHTGYNNPEPKPPRFDYRSSGQNKDKNTPKRPLDRYSSINDEISKINDIYGRNNSSTDNSTAAYPQAATNLITKADFDRVKNSKDGESEKITDPYYVLSQQQKRYQSDQPNLHQTTTASQQPTQQPQSGQYMGSGGGGGVSSQQHLNSSSNNNKNVDPSSSTNTNISPYIPSSYSQQQGTSSSYPNNGSVVSTGSSSSAYGGASMYGQQQQYSSVSSSNSTPQVGINNTAGGNSSVSAVGLGGGSNSASTSAAYGGYMGMSSTAVHPGLYSSAYSVTTSSPGVVSGVGQVGLGGVYSTMYGNPAALAVAGYQQQQLQQQQQQQVHSSSMQQQSYATTNNAGAISGYPQQTKLPGVYPPRY